MSQPYPEFLPKDCHIRTTPVYVWWVSSPSCPEFTPTLIRGATVIQAKQEFKRLATKRNVSCWVLVNATTLKVVKFEHPTDPELWQELTEWHIKNPGNRGKQ